MDHAEKRAEERAKSLPETERQLFESLKAMGMHPAAALRATGGRQGLPEHPDHFEAFRETFVRDGLTEAGATAAAAGRHFTEREARRLYNSPAGGTENEGDRLAESHAANTGLSREEMRKLRLDPSSGWDSLSSRYMKEMPLREALDRADREVLAEYRRRNGDE